MECHVSYSRLSILKIHISDTQSIYIHNIHNSCQQIRDFSLINTIIDQLNEALSNIEYILLGDFNFHHSLLGGLETEIDENTEH